jgi:phosphinothricin acetyltransferase
MLVRNADPARDASACAAIYAPYVRDTAISFEEEPPDAGELRQRIERISQTHPWLVAEQDGDLVGYAYGCPHRERAAYRWVADVSVYVDQRHQRRGIGRALYAALLGLLERQGLHVACAGVTLPNDASVAIHESASSLGRGGTSAGGSSSYASRAPNRRPSQADPQRSMLRSR